MTQLESARRGVATAAMRAAAAAESTSLDTVIAELARGRAVLPWNPRHAPARSMIAGRSFRTKVNANIGGSGSIDQAAENEKLRTALAAGADFVMDLSVGPAASATRAGLLAECPVPLGTVPVYEAVAAQDAAVRFDPERLFEVIETQAREGVDFMTLHAGLLLEHIPLACRRKIGIVSRGGAIMAEWMQRNNAENPLFTGWDRVLAVCREHDVTVSLGDGLRPGCLADAGDDAQYAELATLGGLVRRCREAGVQVMVEGPGHVPFDRIAAQMRREAECCDEAPFYVLGPLVTDIAAGYDHIAAAIGATAAAFHGAALLCYVTPAEHLGLPDAADVRAGVVAFRIAAHAADAARGLPGARAADDAMSEARVNFDWEKQFELALDGQTARRRFERSARAAGTTPAQNRFCDMCGEQYCSMRRMRDIREQSGRPGESCRQAKT